MRVVAAGVSGFLGSRLTKVLTAGGHQVIQLVRHQPSGAGQAGSYQAQWNPDAAELDVDLLAGADAVVNLCGVGVGDKRWNSSYRELIRSSRVRPTELLAKGCAAAGVPVLVNASGIGYYGPHGDELVDEATPAGSSFLGQVCVDWEAATAAADAAGVRVVHLRTGLVLGHEAGLLPKLTLITRLFAGGRLGSGKQYFPWISATDEIDAMVHLLTADVSGPVNICGPDPVTNAEFTRELGRSLRRPTPWVVPRFALQVAVGDFAEEIVNGQRAIPRVLTESGFVFSHATLPEALRSEIH